MRGGEPLNKTYDVGNVQPIIDILLLPTIQYHNTTYIRRSCPARMSHRKTTVNSWYSNFECVSSCNPLFFVWKKWGSMPGCQQGYQLLHIPWQGQFTCKWWRPTPPMQVLAQKQAGSPKYQREIIFRRLQAIDRCCNYALRRVPV